MTVTNKSSGPGVRFPPPFLFAGALLLAWLLETQVLSLPIMERPYPVPLLVTIGYVLVAAGLGVTAWGMVTFARARTAIIPHRAASRLVDTGPYRFTRNPMYTGMTLAYLGGCLLLDSWWAAVLLPVALVLLYRLVVQREERYLAAEFGGAYEDYRRRVKRWI